MHKHLRDQIPWRTPSNHTAVTRTDIWSLVFVCTCSQLIRVNPDDSPRCSRLTECVLGTRHNTTTKLWSASKHLRRVGTSSKSLMTDNTPHGCGFWTASTFFPPVHVRLELTECKWSNYLLMKALHWGRVPRFYWRSKVKPESVFATDMDWTTSTTTKPSKSSIWSEFSIKWSTQGLTQISKRTNLGDTNVLGSLCWKVYLLWLYCNLKIHKMFLTTFYYLYFHPKYVIWMFIFNILKLSKCLLFLSWLEHYYPKGEICVELKVGSTNNNKTLTRPLNP